jgi:hypothetical protein
VAAQNRLSFEESQELQRALDEAHGLDNGLQL